MTPLSPRAPSPHWLPAQADWPAGVQAGFTLRTGGVSQPPCGSWNLGDHVGDDALAVAHNRAQLARQTGVRPVFCRQVHGVGVVHLSAAAEDGAVADACWTEATGVACTMMVADCLPILLAAADGHSVAAVHAGWRGLAGVDGQGVLESLVQDWPAAGHVPDRAGVQVWLGPCIGPQAFEVGDEVRRAFLRQDARCDAAFVPLVTPQGPPKFLADLAGLARLRLRHLGFERIAGNDGSSPWCTVSNPSRFFSHRRDAVRLGSTGRHAACIWRG